MAHSNGFPLRQCTYFSSNYSLSPAYIELAEQALRGEIKDVVNGASFVSKEGRGKRELPKALVATCSLSGSSVKVMNVKGAHHYILHLAPRYSLLRENLTRLGYDNYDWSYVYFNLGRDLVSRIDLRLLFEEGLDSERGVIRFSRPTQFSRYLYDPNNSSSEHSHDPRVINLEQLTQMATGSPDIYYRPFISPVINGQKKEVLQFLFLQNGNGDYSFAGGLWLRGDEGVMVEYQPNTVWGYLTV
jgi:hypothetical protein